MSDLHPSDFIDAGWNIADWCNEGRPIGHPFHHYLIHYNEDLKMLKDAFE